MSAPRVVVGLPVYNGQKYLAAAIDSHLSQSFGNFNLVISDNGSTDATPDICADYASKDARVKYLRSPENRGILWKHRRVLEAIQSPGQYFRWAGADDILGPGLLEAMVALLDAHPDVEVVIPDTKNIDDNGQVIGSMSRVLDLQSPSAYERAHDVLMANYQHVVAYGLLRASTLQAMRTKPNYIGWDPIFIWELALRGKIAQLQDRVLFRRFHKGSISRVKTVNELRKWVEPNAKGGITFPHWKWTYERLRAMMACPLSLSDRLRLVKLLARDVRWQRAKLTHDVLQAARRALGISDEYTF